MIWLQYYFCIIRWSIVHDNQLPIFDSAISGWEYFNRQRLIPTEIHFVCIWQRAYKRSFLLDNELFFADGILRAEDDLFTTMAMYYAKSLRVIQDYVYVYRIREQSITTTVNINRWYDSLRVQEILADFFVPLKGIDKGSIYRVLASGYIGWFSSTTKKLYGNRDKELCSRINWEHFKQTAVTKRHKRLYRLIRISPKLFRPIPKRRKQKSIIPNKWHTFRYSLQIKFPAAPKRIITNTSKIFW